MDVSRVVQDLQKSRCVRVSGMFDWGLCCLLHLRLLHAHLGSNQPRPHHLTPPPLRPSRSQEVIERLASQLAAQKRGFLAAAAASSPAAAKFLARNLGYRWVPDGGIVFRQGDTGDAMLILLSGYCSVAREQQLLAGGEGGELSSRLTSTSFQRRTTAGATSGASTAPPPLSRRVTLERQQHALLMGLAHGSTSMASRRGVTIEAAAASTAPSGPAPSLELGATTSPAIPPRGQLQQTTAPSTAGAPVVWLSEGDSFGEAALMDLSARRGCTATAGDGGVHLATLDHSDWSQLKQLGARGEEGSAEAKAVHQILLGAACRRLLGTPPGQRAADDVHALALLFGGDEVSFDLRSSAPGCVNTHIHPTHTLSITHTPLKSSARTPTHSNPSTKALSRLPETMRLKLAKACAAVTVPAGTVICKQGDRSDAMYVVLRGRCSARVLPLAPSAPPAAHLDAGAGADQIIQAGTTVGPSLQQQQQQQLPLRAAGGRRGVTWEEAAFTEEERQRLEAVKADLKASKQRVSCEGDRMGGLTEVGVIENFTQAVEDSLDLLQTPLTNPQDETGLLKHAAAAEQAETSCAKDSLYWVSKYMEEAAAIATAADPVWGPEGKGLSPLAAVAAAKWRQAVREQQAQRLAAQKVEEKEEAEAKVLRGMEQLLGKGAAKAWAEARRAAAAVSTAGPSSPLSAAVAVPMMAASAMVGDSAAASESAEVQLAGAATAEGALLASPSTVADAQPSTSPADDRAGGECAGSRVSELAQELAARSELDSILGDVAAAAEKRGLPRRLSRKASLKLTKEVNKRVLGGASRKGLPGDVKGSAQFTLPEQTPHDKDSNAADAAAMRRSCDSEGSEARTELTGLGGSEWNSSFGGGSDAASMLGSIEFEGSMLLGAEQGSFYLGGGGGGGGLGSRCGSGGLAAGGGDAQQQAAPSPADLEQRFGAVVRVIEVGESFGERALLSRKWVRAATIVAGDHHYHHQQQQHERVTDDDGDDDRSPEALNEAPSAPAAAAPQQIELLRIGRATFDAAVRTQQLAALEELLAALSYSKPLAGLAREQLTALAIFCRPLAAAAGEVIAAQGERVTGLTVVAEGEVRLLDGPAPLSVAALVAATAAAGTLAAQRRDDLPQSALSKAQQAPRAPAFGRRRATADVALPLSNIVQQPRALLRTASLPSGRTAAGPRVTAEVGTTGGLPGVVGVLTDLSAGGLLGENVLGEDGETVSTHPNQLLR